MLFEGKSLPSRTLFWRYAKSHAARSGPWKLVVAGGKTPELYNLTDDLGETRDLAGRQPERVQQLRSALAAWDQEVTSNGGLRKGAASSRFQEAGKLRR